MSGTKQRDTDLGRKHHQKHTSIGREMDNSCGLLNSRNRSSGPKRLVVKPPPRIARSRQENPAMATAGRSTTHYDQIELLIPLTLCELFPHASRRRTASSRPAPALAARTSGLGVAGAPCARQSCAL